MLRVCRHEHAVIVRRDAKADQVVIEVCLPELNAVLRKTIKWSEWGHTQDCKCECCVGLDTTEG